MQDNKTLSYIKDVLKNMPTDWLNLTTHRLDIYNEKLAKTQFLDKFENLYKANNTEQSALSELPTAYDYIRLGHPLSCILEWAIANLHQLQPEHVISFSSQTVPVLAILRHNLLHQKKTQIIYTDKLPKSFDAELIKSVYGYDFELIKTDDIDAILKFEGSTIFMSQQDNISTLEHNINIDFFINLHGHLGSVLIVNGSQNANYISDIQHVRRRETIAMTPANCLVALKALIDHQLLYCKKDIYCKLTKQVF